MDPFTGILLAGVGQTVAAPDYLQVQHRPVGAGCFWG